MNSAIFVVLTELTYLSVWRVRHIHHLDLPWHKDPITSCKYMKKGLLTSNCNRETQMPRRRLRCLPVTLAVKVQNLEPQNHPLWLDRNVLAVDIAAAVDAISLKLWCFQDASYLEDSRINLSSAHFPSSAQGKSQWWC